MLKFWITSVFNENLQETLEGWIGRNVCFHNFKLFYFPSGESLKKSHLMDSSSDIMNMEEGGPVFSGRTTVDYTKVKFHRLSTWVWGFWPTIPTWQTLRPIPVILKMRNLFTSYIFILINNILSTSYET